MSNLYTKRPGFVRELAGTGYVPEFDSLRVVVNNESLFGEVKTTSRTPVIELNSAYGTSSLRDSVTTANGGTKDDINGTVTSGEILLETNTSANGSVLLESAEVGRYIPGYGAELGMGVRLPAAATGTQFARWGGIDTAGNNGFYYGSDSGGIYVARLDGGVETDKAYQSAWNIDKMDGTGRSGVTLDTTKGNIYQIEFSWYGYGQIIFGIVAVVNNKQTFIPVHNMSGFSNTSIANPSLRVFNEVDNGASSTTNFQMYVGGRQYSISGLYVPKYRFTGQHRAGVTVGTSTLPLISFRVKSAFRDRSIKLDSFEIINNGSVDGYAHIILDGSLTGASWVNPTNYTAADTALETDISATGISGGSAVFGGALIPAGTNQSVSLTGASFELDLPEEGVFTLCATALSSTASMVSSFRLREEW